ncbi:MAG: YdcF family protein [Ilumatobacteraceae bacterium]
MAERELHVPSDAERAADARILAALGEHQSIGERYLRTGEIPVSDPREPSMSPSPEAGIQRDPTPLQPVPRPPRGVWRTVARAALVVAGLAILYGVVSLWQVWSTGRSDQTRNVDAIVVLGAAQYDGRPSPQLAARLDHALELWPDGLAPIIIVTGGNRPGDRYTEAEASANYLIERGVSGDSIRREDEGASTYESLQGIRELVGDDVQSLLLVTDPYHALRSRLIAQELGYRAYVSPVDDSVVTGINEMRRELGEAAGVALGRIIGFDRLSGLTD